MAKRTPIDKFGAAVEEILREYGQDVAGGVREATIKVTKEAVKAVRAESKAKFKGTGKYAKGWTSTMQTGHLSTQGTVYNKVYQLPHLLEKGHAMRNGGRVQGRPHISTVEDAVIEKFEKMVERTV